MKYKCVETSMVSVHFPILSTMSFTHAHARFDCCAYLIPAAHQNSSQDRWEMNLIVGKYAGWLTCRKYGSIQRAPLHSSRPGPPLTVAPSWPRTPQSQWYRCLWRGCEKPRGGKFTSRWRAWLHIISQRLKKLKYHGKLTVLYCYIWTATCGYRA